MIITSLWAILNYNNLYTADNYCAIDTRIIPFSEIFFKYYPSETTRRVAHTWFSRDFSGRVEQNVVSGTYNIFCIVLWAMNAVRNPAWVCERSGFLSRFARNNNLLLGRPCVSAIAAQARDRNRVTSLYTAPSSSIVSQFDFTVTTLNNRV